MFHVTFGRRRGLDVHFELGSKSIRVRLDIFGFFLALAFFAVCSLLPGTCTSCLGWIYEAPIRSP